tara:strand:- start:6 stop:842 length:837 start_codon:yes stop_codon:yes gene_type:complete
MDQVKKTSYFFSTGAGNNAPGESAYYYWDKFKGFNPYDATHLDIYFESAKDCGAVDTIRLTIASGKHKEISDILLNNITFNNYALAQDDSIVVIYDGDASPAQSINSIITGCSITYGTPCSQIGQVWNDEIAGYTTGITSTTNYHHRLPTTVLNWTLGTTTDPTSFSAYNATTPFFIAHSPGKITQVNIQGQSDTRDAFRFYIYKAAASSSEVNVSLTLLHTTASIIPPVVSRTYSYHEDVDSAIFSQNDRLYIFYKKGANTAGTDNYWSISVSGEYT